MSHDVFTIHPENWNRIELQVQTRWYCQELCSEEYGSGGVSELENSVGEGFPFEEGEDQRGGIEFAPVLGR